MTIHEVKRLMADLERRDDLARELAALEHNAASWLRCAAAHGYELTPQEVEELLCAGLGDDDLEKVAGGWEGDGSDGGTGDGGTGDGGTGGG